MKSKIRASLLAGLVAGAVPVSATVFVGFEDLPSAPPVTGVASLMDANGGSSVLGGVTWDTRLRVLGAENRTSDNPLNPLSSIPHGGSFFITNEAYPDAGNGILLGTSQILTGAWFSQVEYYGFGHAAMTVTIEAMSGATVLGSASVELPANGTSGPLPMEFLDTGSFATLLGITGYRINQSPLDAGSRYWSADDFQFASVPEPGLASVAAAGALGLFAAGALRRRCRNS